MLLSQQVASLCGYSVQIILAVAWRYWFMNLSTLERMVKNGDLSLSALLYLLNCRCECEWLDYKEMLFLESDAGVAGFSRDVLAMKNTGGGYIVVGVQDKTWEPVGIAEELPYDTKLLRDKARRGTGLNLEVDIVHHSVSHGDKTILIAIVLIRGTAKRNKRRMPSLVKSDFHPREKYGLRRGEIYARRGDETVKVDSAEMLEPLLNDLEDRTDSADLAVEQAANPFEIDTGLYRIQPRDFDVYIGRASLRQKVIDAVLRDPRIWIINIHGPGGVGKSAIATWTAYYFYEKRVFESIIQLTAKDVALTDKGIRPNRGRTLHSLDDLLDRICVVFEESPPDDIDKKKQLVTEILSAWSCLLILDNMETVTDARIIEYIQSLPDGTKAKVILTSRHRTGGWEFPITVSDLNTEETREFVGQKALELSVKIPEDDQTIESIRRASGGLPLAMQWLMGHYRRTSDLNGALSAVNDRSSPVLEFSFRNIWNMLPSDARTILAVLSIFDDSPTSLLLSIVTELPSERVESALDELAEVTLVSRRAGEMGGGQEIIVALPITLSFSGFQLDQMGDLSSRARKTLQTYTQQMELRTWEVDRFAGVFARYRITSDNEKRATILSRRGESETFSGNLDSARDLFRQARDLAPNSAYVYAMSANFELAAGGRVNAAHRFAESACRYANKSTGSLAWSVRARVSDKERDRQGQINALRKALEYDLVDNILRHQLGVALSRAGESEAAIAEFSKIIENELQAESPRDTLLMALKTRIINLRRLGRNSAATADLALAYDLLERYPYLSAQRIHIDELVE